MPSFEEKKSGIGIKIYKMYWPKQYVIMHFILQMVPKVNNIYNILNLEIFITADVTHKFSNWSMVCTICFDVFMLIRFLKCN